MRFTLEDTDEGYEFAIEPSRGARVTARLVIEESGGDGPVGDLYRRVDQEWQDLREQAERRPAQ